IWEVDALEKSLEADFGVSVQVGEWVKSDHSLEPDGIREKVLESVTKAYEDKVEAIGEPVMRHFEKAVMLQQLDSGWKEHLASMDYLRQGIHLRGYAQKNPKQEYKREAYEMFTELLDRVKHDTVSILSRVQVRTEEEVEAMERQRRESSRLKFQHAAAPQATAAPAAQPVGATGAPAQEQSHTPFVRDQKKVGRNEPCPCGSGKKYKHCHGRLS
ncbi:MAG: SEC-C metal-binding domain-containing protein, partial [Gammaproteobacteria bacterium]